MGIGKTDAINVPVRWTLINIDHGCNGAVEQASERATSNRYAT